MQQFEWVHAAWLALAIALLFFGLKEPTAAITHKRTNPITRANLRLLGRSYWWVVSIGAIFTLARFSEAFLVLKAQQGGTPLALIPLVMVAMNLVYACSAYPFGKLSDRTSHEGLLKAGLLVLIAADLVLALSDHWGGVLFGVALWGVHMGMTQGLLAAMVAHTAPAHLRGTAFGMFNLISGVALLLALAEDRDIIMLDEWAADQDPHFRREFYQVLLPLMKEMGKTLFAISHDDHYFQHADRLLEMRGGQLSELTGNERELATRDAVARTA